MTARILDGKAIAAQVRREVAVRVATCQAHGVLPGLGVVLVGENPASQVYVRNKTKACQEVGIRVEDQQLSAEASPAALLRMIEQWNQDSSIHGILVQLPLPPGWPTQALLESISPHKDVDGLLADNVGRLWQGQPRFVPCTPLGVMHLLAATQVPLAGAHAVVVGRSGLVGKPVAGLLLAADATVTICHSKTTHMDELVGRADVVVAAVGQPQLIKGMWIREGATVIDVGINRLSSGQLVGDVEFECAKERAAWISPVPGGVGPMTIAMLLHNTVLSAERLSPLRGNDS